MTNKIASKASGFLAILGALLTMSVLFYALNASGARKGFAEGNCDDANVALWEDFEETSGNLTVPTGCAAAATVFTATGSPTYSADGANGTGKAVTFNGTNAYFVASGDVAALDPLTSDMVVEGWFARSVLTGSLVIVSHINNDFASGWAVFSSGAASLQFRVGTAAQTCTATSNTAAPADGLWHYFRGTWVNSTGICTLAVDTGTAGSTTNAAMIGASINSTAAPEIGGYNGASNFWNGSIADLRVTIGNATNDLSVKTRTAAPSFFVNGKLPAKQKAGNCTDSNVALWEDFEETSGNLTVPSGCAAAGTVLTQSGGTATYQFGNPPPGIGQAIQVASADVGPLHGFTSTSDVAALDLTTGSTALVIEGWARLGGTAASSQRIEKYDSGTDRGYQLWLSLGAGGTTGGWDFYLADGTNTCESYQIGSTAILGDTWFHFRATWDGTTCAVTVDGLNGAQTTLSAARTGAFTSAIDNTSAFIIGSYTSSTFAFADLRITIGNSTNDLGFNAGAHSGFSGSTLTAPTFTRATTSTRVNPVTGRVEAVSSGVPVVGSPLSGGDDGSIDPTEPTGVYVGSATTFLALNNAAMNGNWGGFNTTIADSTADVVAPDGTSTAEKVTGTGANAYLVSATQTTGCVGAVTCTATAWVRTLTGTADTDIAVVSSALASAGYTSFTATTTWQRVTVTSNGASLGTGGRILFGTNTVFPVGTIYIWRPELYQKAFAVPLDPAVTSSAVTVNADSVTFAQTWGTDRGAVCTWMQKTGTNANDGLFSVQAAGGNPPRLLGLAPGRTRLLTQGLSTEMDTGSSLTAYTNNAWTFVCADWNQAASLISVQTNATLETVSDSWTASQSAGAVLTLGTTVSSTAGVFLSDFRYFSSGLSAQQMRALYLNKSSVYASRDITPREKLRRHVMLASARPLDFLWGIFGERRRKADDIEWARDYVNSDSFPQASWTMPEASP